MIEPPRAGFTPRRCVTNKHAWHALCACEGTAVCLRCGLGQGTVPCRCMESNMSLNLCACGCGRQADPHIALCDSGGAWWRFSCAARVLKGLRCLQNLPPDDLGVLVSVLRAHGFGLADTVVCSLPFEVEQVTDE